MNCLTTAINAGCGSTRKTASEAVVTVIPIGAGGVRVSSPSLNTPARTVAEPPVVASSTVT